MGSLPARSARPSRSEGCGRLSNPQSLLWGNPQDTEDSAGNSVEEMRRVVGSLVVAIIEHDLLPFVRVCNFANVNTEKEARGTNKPEGWPHPRVHIRDNVRA